MSEPRYEDLPELFSAIMSAGPTSTIIDQDTGEIFTEYTFMLTPPSTPVLEAKDLTKDERAAIEAREPPYDGVRTYGDLLVVRKQAKGKAK